MKRVVVEWLDVTKLTNAKGLREDINPDDLPSKMKTIGWLYKKTKKTLLLVQEWDEDDVRDWIAIPRCLVIRIHTINS